MAGEVVRCPGPINQPDEDLRDQRPKTPPRRRRIVPRLVAAVAIGGPIVAGLVVVAKLLLPGMLYCLVACGY